jgi:L-threonylcarbamoyladenylate synthase
MSCRPVKISKALAAINAGDVIAYPTEAVWGLGCDPFNREAVHQILELKKRPEEKGLILVAGAMRQFDFLLQDLSVPQRAQLESAWPGPTTWLVPHHNRVPHWISGRFDSVAVRVSSHPLIRDLTRDFGPIVSTSANPQGLAPARDSLRVRRYFGKRVHIVPGVLGKQRNPSEIRDLRTGKTVRPG